jgi:hypothetical protein
LKIKEVVDKLKLSDKTKEAIKDDFEGITGRLEIDLNQGGVRDATVKVKVK